MQHVIKKNTGRIVFSNSYKNVSNRSIVIENILVRNVVARSGVKLALNQ